MSNDPLMVGRVASHDCSCAVFCEDLYRTANPNLGFGPWSLDSAKMVHGPAVRGPVVKATHDFDKS